MGRFGEIMAASASPTTKYAERLLAGITADQFARFARPGGVLVHSNHPAFIFGHLSLYPARVLQCLNQPLGDAQPPAGFEAVFKNGVECRDDPDGTIYPPMETVTEFFFASYPIAFAALRHAPDAVLTGPNPTEGRMRDMFPTLGAMLGFYLDGHAQSHLGQLSAWRRMMGLPAA